MNPTDALQQILTEAYMPCRNFGFCKQARWEPAAGHIPRGFLGATGHAEDVEVVFVFAEPGFPHDGERYDPDLSPDEMLQSVTRYVLSAFAYGKDQFHRNVRWFLDQLYPGATFDDQLTRVWMTEGRLCSIDLELGDARDHTCARHFLQRQIGALPNATVIAFGGKGQAYLKRLGLPHLRAHAFAPPGCNYKAARPSWEAAIAEVQRRRQGDVRGGAEGNGRKG